MNKEEIQARINEINKEIELLESLSLIYKIKINSLYGSLATPYSRWYDIRIASAVTYQGQLSIRGAGYHVTNKLKDVNLVYIDTDSLNMSLKNIVDKRYGDNIPDNETVSKFLLKYHDKILNPCINNFYDTMFNNLNSFKRSIKMEHELISNVGCFIEKKKYALKIVYKEGDWYLDKTKLKVKGIEVVRSSTPQIVRDALKKSLEIILETQDNDKLIKYINSFKPSFYESNIEAVSFPRGINLFSGTDKIQDKDTKEFVPKPYTLSSSGLPIQVRAALIYNKALKEFKLLDKYPEIKDGDKIKFLYIKTPNVFGSNIIGFHSKFPLELLEHIHIDYDLQWEKAFKNPLKKILDCIDWDFEPKLNLDAFFN